MTFTAPVADFPSDVLRVARTAEDAGYDAFFRSDHYLQIGEVSVSRARPTPG